MEAGLDSLGAVELRTQLADRFSIELPATITFDYPSPNALASFVTTHMMRAEPIAPQNETEIGPRMDLDDIQSTVREIVASIIGHDLTSEQVDLIILPSINAAFYN